MAIGSNPIQDKSKGIDWGSIAGGIGSFIGGQSQADAYEQQANQLNQFAQDYNPYIDRGNNAGNLWFDLQQKLVNNPNFLQDQIASGYKSSPYQQQLINDTTRQMNINAANSGMIQSPAAQMALNDRINTMSGQFMNDYLRNGLESYRMGFEGLGGLSQQGIGALQGKGEAMGAGSQAQANAGAASSGGLGELMGGFIGGFF